MRSDNPSSLPFKLDDDFNVAQMVVSDDEDSLNRKSRLEEKIDALTALIKAMNITNEAMVNRVTQLEGIVAELASSSSSLPSSVNLSSINFRVTLSSKQTMTKDVVESKGITRLPTSQKETYEEFKRILAGEINSKGGNYSYDHMQSVHMIDEEKFGKVVGETRHYIRIEVEGETYNKSTNGRLKLKGSVKAILSGKNKHKI
jgi:hypothetical protein